MQTKGIVRKIDELGRIVLPVELRKTLRIAEGDSLEITCADDGIMLKKKGLLVDCEAFCRAAASGEIFRYCRIVRRTDTQTSKSQMNENRKACILKNMTLQKKLRNRLIP